jgi:hypothetical protein
VRMMSDLTSSPPALAGESERIASSTPYLDRELPLPRPNPRYRHIRPWQTLIILIIFAFITPLEIYLLILSVILVHEVGHCAAGLLVGLDFHEIRVGPVALDHYRKVSWSWNWWTISSGNADMSPTGGAALPIRLAIYIVCGPMANAASGVLVLSLMPGGNSQLAGFVELFAAGSFVFAFVNLIPFQSSGFSSDGMRLWMLAFSKKKNRWVFLINRQAAIRRGEGAPEAEPGTIQTEIDDGSSDHVHANWAAYMAANGKRNYELAGRHLEICLSRCSTVSPDFREELMLAAARFQAVGRKRPDVAREWLNNGNPSKARVNRASTDALVLFSEGKIDLALAKVDEGEGLVAQLPNSPQRTRQEEAWRKLRDLLSKSRPLNDENPPSSSELRREGT